MRRGLALCILAALAAPAPSTAQLRTPRDPGFQPLEPVEQDVEADVLERTNAFRQQQGLASLKESAVLTGEARAYAALLARRGGLDHDEDGLGTGGRARAAGYAYCRLAENLAYEEDASSFRGRDLAGDFVEGWKASPRHRSNMLIAQVVDVGVGVARADARGRKYVAVQVFGRPATLRYGFEVTNRSQSVVSYDLAGRTVRLAPRTRATHRLCEDANLVFRGPGGRPISYPAAPGMLYVLSQDDRGVRVEMRRGP